MQNSQNTQDHFLNRLYYYKKKVTKKPPSYNHLLSGAIVPTDSFSKQSFEIALDKKAQSKRYLQIAELRVYLMLE